MKTNEACELKLKIKYEINLSLAGEMVARLTYDYHEVVARVFPKGCNR